MPKLPRTCPECYTPLGSTRPLANGKVRCPECDALIAPEPQDDGTERRVQAKPGTPRSAAPIPTPRSASRNTAVRPPAKGSGALLLVLGLGLGLGFLFLLVVGGGFAAWMMLRPVSTPAVADVQPEKSSDPVFVPVVMPDGGPPQKNPPDEKQPPKPPDVPVKPVPPVEVPPIVPAGGLPLDDLKAASVFIKAQTATMAASGSGFVIRVQGDTAYVVTNHHVVTPPTDTGRPIGRPPIRPGLPTVVQLTVVFRSGTGKEESCKAEIVADDKEADLAVLKVSGVQDPPKPLNCDRGPKLVETMPVLAFGFPFGSALDPKHKNPAITITKGAVSSLRLDRDELAEVQLDLDLNPGNSGGPVVDEKGTLIGVAVAKIGNTKIGFAIPIHKLERLMGGQIDTPTSLHVLTRNGKTEVRVVGRCADPLGKLRNPTLLYGTTDRVKMPARANDGWDALAGATAVGMTIEGGNAVALLDLVPPAKGELKILVQVSYVNETGKTVYSEPKTLSLGAPALPPLVFSPDKLPAGDDLNKLLADLKAAEEPTRLRAADALTKWPPKERRDEVRQALEELLTAPDPATRIAGVKAVAAYHPKEMPPVLMKRLEDDAAPVRHAVLNLIKERADARCAEAVAARLGPDGGSAADVLKVIGPAAEKAVLPYLTDKNQPVRNQAFEVVKEIGGPASVAPLQEVIRAKGPDTRSAEAALARVLERVPLTKEEWPQALDDLKAPDAARRTGAVRRIAVTPPVGDRRKELLERLEGLFNDQSNDVRAAAAKGLARWGGKEVLPILAKRLETADVFNHGVWLDALAEIKDEAAATLLAKRLADAFDRDRVTRALKALEPAVAEKALLTVLTDTNDFLRTEVCKMLADVGGRDSVAPLEKLVKDNNVFYTGQAKLALAAVNARLEAGDK